MDNDGVNDYHKIYKQSCVKAFRSQRTWPGNGVPSPSFHRLPSTATVHNKTILSVGIIDSSSLLNIGGDKKEVMTTSTNSSSSVV